MRAHLFQGDDYYPMSGTGDYVKVFDDVDEAFDYANDPENQHGADWWVILVDTVDGLTEWDQGRYE